MNKIITIATAFTCIALFSTSSLAKNEEVVYQGTISEIDANGKTFTITEVESNGPMTFQTTPATDFENKSKSGAFSFSDDIEFDFLQKGDWVSVEIVPSYETDSHSNVSVIIADEVDVFRK